MPRPVVPNEEFLRILEEEGGNRQATAKRLDINIRAVFKRIKRLKESGVRVPRSYATIQPASDEGRPIYQTTTQVDADGNIERQWQRSAADRIEREREALRAFVEELQAEIKPRKRRAVGRKTAARDLLTGYPIGDHHFGMYAHHAEAGGDYDLKIAKQLLEEAIDDCVENSPPSERALLCNLGDFLHINDRTNKTQKSGNILSADSRYFKVARVAGFALAHATERLLDKHKYVRVVNCVGNHDPDAVHWLTLFLHAWFRKEPRVEVDMSPAHFKFHEFGANMICMTHGDTVKLPDVPSRMAALAPEMWGRTKYRVAWTGHVHHGQTVWGKKEDSGAIAHSFGVLPPTDDYAASLGLTAHRELHAITFHRAGGVRSEYIHNVDLHGAA